METVTIAMRKQLILNTWGQQLQSWKIKGHTLRKSEISKNNLQILSLNNLDETLKRVYIIFIFENIPSNSCDSGFYVVPHIHFGVSHAGSTWHP